MVAERGTPPVKLVPPLEALLGLWRRRYEGRPLPERSRFDVAELAPWARNLCWIEFAAADRFRVRRFGMDLVRRFGRESSEEYIDALAGDVASSLHEVLRQVLRTAAPAGRRTSIEMGHVPALFCDLALPLAGDAERVREFLLASYELNPPPGLYR